MGKRESTNNHSADKRIGSNFNAFVGGLLVLLGGLSIPGLFENIFSSSPLLAREISALNVLPVPLALSGVVLLLMKRRVSTSITLVVFGLVSIVALELGFRLACKFGMTEDTKALLHKLQLQTYDDYAAFMGHPFLGYTRRPNVQLDGSESIAPIYHYNKYGFNGLEIPYKKPDGVIRIAAMGGSTTARGYPEILQSYLDSAHGKDQFQVLNFGISGWTSAHTMINYLLNVVEFDPDYLIIQQGWNEEKIRNVPKENFRPDYTHALSHYREPIIMDRYLARVSLVYRYIISKLERTPPWAYLGNSTTHVNREQTEIEYSNLDELEPFERNTRTILNHALDKGMRVLLTTLPYSKDPEIQHGYAARNIEQCNEITRSLADSSLVLIDLEQIMGKMKPEIFLDLAHMTEEGRKRKAQLIGVEILKDLSSR